MRTRQLAVAAGTSAALAAAAYALYRHFAGQQRSAADNLNSMLPVHSAWWRDRMTRSGALVYIALGDSAAQGIGASNPGRSYVGRLSTLIRHASHGSVRTINLGVSGATTRLCRRDQLPRLEKYTGDIVTVAIGANDIIGFEPEPFERNIRAIYSALPAHAIVAEVPAMFLPDRERKITVANRIIHRVADELGLTVAPLHETTRRQGLVRTFFNSAGDLFHPNDNGYQVWAAAFEPAIAARLAQLADAAADAPRTAD
ncbi:SGNH/GDSL hydrolase family protein [Frigoribacterium sp. 2-23]|uniref:SGNH/GDSL hydrolase family protein n=1 Tax=Frigoribacterium sp. 2-23 TaxID=3415006 RepID=UPI003C7045A0